MTPERDHILDEWLVMQAQTGDMKAYSILVKRWHPKMLSHAYRMTQDTEVAKDITQETWKAITSRLRSLKSPGAFRVWVYRIISNKAADWIKTRQKERALIRESDELQVAEETDSNVNSIRVALNELPEESKLMLTMFYLDGHSVKAISEILNISEGTVKSRLFYSRKKLKEKFTHLNSEK
jgi:RNA polymerase sigma-70 factor (ECF subfamily)